MTYFLLGRILSKLDHGSVYPTLQRWMTYACAKHVSRGALCTFEVFDLCGPAYIFVSSLSPPVLSEMSATGFADFVRALEVQVLLVRLTEQTPSEEDDVMVTGDADDAYP